MGLYHRTMWFTVHFPDLCIGLSYTTLPPVLAHAGVALWQQCGRQTTNCLSHGNSCQISSYTSTQGRQRLTMCRGDRLAPRTHWANWRGRSWRAQNVDGDASYAPKLITPPLLILINTYMYPQKKIDSYYTSSCTIHCSLRTCILPYYR